MDNLRLLGVVVAWTIVATASRAGADTIYDNSKNDLLTRFNPGNLEVGDEIVLAGSARYLTNFAFEFWAENPSSPDLFSGDVQARVKMTVRNLMVTRRPVRPSLTAAG